MCVYLCLIFFIFSYTLLIFSFEIASIVLLKQNKTSGHYVTVPGKFVTLWVMAGISLLK